MPAYEKYLTHELALAKWYYDPESGKFYDKVTGKCLCGLDDNKAYIAISFRPNKYRQLKIFAHRLAFFYMTKRWPKQNHVIDHINGDPQDNSWANLREVTRSENAMNLQGKSRPMKLERDIYKKLYEEQLAEQGGPWLLLDSLG